MTENELKVDSVELRALGEVAGQAMGTENSGIHRN